MNYQAKLIEMRVAAEDAIRHLELAVRSAEAGIYKCCPPDAPPELKELNIALLKASITVDCEKSMLLWKLGLPIRTRFVNLPRATTV